MKGGLKYIDSKIFTTSTEIDMEQATLNDLQKSLKNLEDVLEIAKTDARVENNTNYETQRLKNQEEMKRAKAAQKKTYDQQREKKTHAQAAKIMAATIADKIFLQR